KPNGLRISAKASAREINDHHNVFADASKRGNMTLGSHQTTIGKSQSWIKPKFIIDDLGPFDLDPCECDDQPWPCAALGYKKDGLGGLGLPWSGFVWLNPPFHRYEVALWIKKLADHGKGIALVHARTEAEWFLPIWQNAQAIGF